MVSESFAVLKERLEAYSDPLFSLYPCESMQLRIKIKLGVDRSYSLLRH